MKIDKEQAVLLVIDMQPRFLDLVPDHEQILANCEWLKGLAGDISVPVLFSAHYSRGMGPVSEVLMQDVPLERCVDKTFFSCVEDGCLNNLPEAGKKQWILCGIETHACVMLTALDLAAAGKQVFLVVDAVASRSSVDREYALRRMTAAGITLVTREMVFFELLRKAGTPEFKACSRKYLR
jgi:nicotinamidase-related amidase